LAATNEGSKYRALKIYDRQISSADGTVYTSEDLSEVLGRPDQTYVFMRFANVVGSPQVTFAVETSFDGVYYMRLDSIPFNIASGTIAAVFYVGLHVRVRYALSLNSGSCEVRAHARSIMAVPDFPGGRRRFGVSALDKVLVGNIAYYSEADFNDMFGAVDYLSVIILADQAQGVNPTISVTIEESPDGIEWSSLIVLLANEPIPLDNGAFTDIESLGSKFVRFRVSLGGTDNSAYVRLHVVGRGQ